MSKERKNNEDGEDEERCMCVGSYRLTSSLVLLSAYRPLGRQAGGHPYDKKQGIIQFIVSVKHWT
jgi:hypothetical protein